MLLATSLVAVPDVSGADAGYRGRIGRRRNDRPGAGGIAAPGRGVEDTQSFEGSGCNESG